MSATSSLRDHYIKLVRQDMTSLLRGHGDRLMYSIRQVDTAFSAESIVTLQHTLEDMQLLASCVYHLHCAECAADLSDQPSPYASFDA